MINAQNLSVFPFLQNRVIGIWIWVHHGGKMVPHRDGWDKASTTLAITMMMSLNMNITRETCLTITTTTAMTMMMIINTIYVDPHFLLY